MNNSVAAACAELNVPLVAYSPLSRGLLSGPFKSTKDIPETSLLHHFPRFQPDAFSANLQVASEVEALAKKKGCTLAQLAINWTIAMGKRPGLPTIIPIPGATSTGRIEENSKQVQITDAELSQLEATMDKLQVSGDRYPHFAPVEG